MDTWLLLLCTFAPIIIYLVGWTRDPFNRVKLLRMVYRKRNWLVIQLCFPGGQTMFYVVRGDSPTVTVSKYTFPITADAMRYVGSVPFLVFSTEDTNPIVLTNKKEAGKEPYRNPEHLTNFLMLAKAYFEAVASRKKSRLEIMLYVVIVLVGLTLVLAFNNSNAIGELQAAIAPVSSVAQSALVNQIG